MVKEIEDMHNRLDRIPQCDGRTDGQTDGETFCHGIVRAMHTRRAVKSVNVNRRYTIGVSSGEHLRGSGRGRYAVICR